MPARPSPAALLGSLALPGVLLLSACASPSPSGSAGGDQGADRVSISASEEGCDVARTDLDAGPTTFVVANEGSQVTEVYVYAEQGGAFTRVLSEVENIGPGTSRELAVALAAGRYEVACKPGQTSEGIRTPITVAGGAGSADSSDQPSPQAAYDRELELSTDGTQLSGLDGDTATQGERVEVKLANDSDGPRTLEVKGPDGSLVGEVEAISPGSEGELVVELDEAGTWQVIVEGGEQELSAPWPVS